MLDREVCSEKSPRIGLTGDPVASLSTMWKKCEVWAYRLAALGWVLLLSWESGKPGTEVHIQPPIDKVVHASAFGVLGYFLALGSGGRLQKHVLWLVPLLVMSFGLLDEYHQSFSVGRSVSAGDVLADTTGGIAAAIAWWLAKQQGIAAANRNA